MDSIDTTLPHVQYAEMTSDRWPSKWGNGSVEDGWTLNSFSEPWIQFTVQHEGYCFMNLQCDVANLFGATPSFSLAFVDMGYIFRLVGTDAYTNTDTPPIYIKAGTRVGIASLSKSINENDWNVTRDWKYLWDNHPGWPSWNPNPPYILRVTVYVVGL